MIKNGRWAKTVWIATALTLAVTGALAEGWVQTLCPPTDPFTYCWWSEDVPGPRVDVSFTPDGRGLVVGSWTAITVYELATGQARRIFPSPQPWTGFGRPAVSPDGRWLAAGLTSGEVWVWDLATGERALILAAHRAEAPRIAFSPDSTFLVSCSWAEGKMNLWDVPGGGLRYTIAGPFGPHSLPVFSPDGQVLAMDFMDNTIQLWDVVTGHEIGKLIGHAATVRGLTFSPDGRTLASCAYDHTVRLWDVTRGQATFVTYGPNALVAFSPTGRLLAAAGEEGLIRLWEVGTGRVVHTIDLGPLRNLTAGDLATPVVSLAFSPDGSLLTSASLWVTKALARGVLHLWHVAALIRAEP